MDATLRTALDYAECGYSVHWLRSRSKIPILRDWAQVPVASLDVLQRTYRPGFNVGVRCGHWSQPMPGYGLVVIDIDVKTPGAHPEPFEMLGRFYDDPVVEVLSGSGLGRHWWFACPLDALPPKANYTLAASQRTIIVRGHEVPDWQIEILSTGKNLVVPPSIHPDTGSRYRWLTPLEDLLELPETIRTLACRVDPPRQAPRTISPNAHAGNSIADAFRAVPWADILEPHGWQFVRQQGDRDQWARPGKEARDGISATTTGDVFYCFSSSTVFEQGRGYSKFQAYTILEHHGDMSQAARALHALNTGRAA